MRLLDEAKERSVFHWVIADRHPADRLGRSSHAPLMH
jgi:hypothetical protein